MNLEHKTSEWLEGRLREAIERFNASTDVQLLEDEKADDGKYYGSVGECAITHRLAVHLEKLLAEYGYLNDEAKLYIDCEYNRHLGKLKEQDVIGKLKKRVEQIKKHELEQRPE